MSVDLVRHVRDRLPEISAVSHRFPLAVISALVLTLYHLFEINRGAGAGDTGFELSLRVTLALSAAFLWGLGSVLWAERHRLSAKSKVGLGLLGWVAIFFFFLRDRSVSMEWGLVLLAGTIALSVVGYCEKTERNGEVWQFNHDLWIGWCVAVLAMTLFAGGVSIIIETLRYLFGLPVPYKLHEKIWTIACGFVAPVYWLSVVPRDLEARVVEGEQTEFTSRSIAALVRFILVPLLLAYAAILHVYALKILADQALPRNRIGWLVLSYGAVMAVTALCAYPTRQTGGRLVALFWRIWPWLLVLPTIMLFLAIRARIVQYGVTEERYLVVLAGIWLTGLVVTQGVLAARRDLRLLTGSLAVLFALASLGPWGMTGWSVRSQVNALTLSLAAAGAVKDGRLQPDIKPGGIVLPSAQRERLHDIIDYLDSRGKLGALQPLFAGQSSDPFKSATATTAARNGALANELRDRLGLGARPVRSNDARSFVTYNSQSTAVFSMPAASRLIGPIVMTSTEQNQEPKLVTIGDEKFFVTLEASSLTLRDEKGNQTRFDLTALIAADGSLLSQQSQSTTRRNVPIAVPADGGTAVGKLILTTINGQRQENGQLRLTYITFWLMLGSAP